MSIHSIEQSLSEAIRPRGEQSGDRKPVGTEFARQLQQAEQNAAVPPVSASAAAELLRLQMMQSAITLCRDEADAPPAPFGGAGSMQNLLQLFRSLGGSEAAEPVPEGSVSATAGTAIPAPAAVAGAIPLSMDDIIQKAAARYGVDGRLIKAVIKAESNFNPNAVSHAGAQGLMQLMPATARGVGVTNSFDPEQNVMGGTKFLKAMLNRYGGDVDAALAAYNWGPGNVDRKPDALPRETRNYLVKVKKYYTEFTG